MLGKQPRDSLALDADAVDGMLRGQLSLREGKGGEGGMSESKLTAHSSGQAA